jgi:hypothetical protein
MPWPNAIYLKPDATTVTGWRVALHSETLPVAHASGNQIDTTRWDMADGFSASTSMLYYFAERIDPASLVPEGDIPRATRSSRTSGVDEISGDFSKLPYSTDRLQQALVNAMVPARTMRAQIVKDPAMTVSASRATRQSPTRRASPTTASLWAASWAWPSWATTCRPVAPGTVLRPARREHAPAALADADPLRHPATIAPYILNAPLRGVPKKQVLSQMGLR